MDQVNILVIYHSQGGNTRRLAQAVAQGVEQAEGGRAWLRPAARAGLDELMSCHGLAIGSPEYFGYMAGAVKDFFDRTYEPARGKKEVFKKPYVSFFSAGNDGALAAASVERICRGYPLRKVQEPLIVVGEVDQAALDQARELGMLIAAGVEAGIF